MNERIQISVGAVSVATAKSQLVISLRVDTPAGNEMPPPLLPICDEDDIAQRNLLYELPSETFATVTIRLSAPANKSSLVLVNDLFPP